MKIKVQYGSDIRRWHSPPTHQYQALVEFCRTTFNFTHEGTFYLQFEDDEGDRMSLTSENDFNDAFMAAEQENRKSLKIFLVRGSIQDAQQSFYPEFAGSAPSVVSASTDHQYDMLSDANVSRVESIPESFTAPEFVVEETSEVQSAQLDPEALEYHPANMSRRELLADFLADEAVSILLPDFIREVMRRLRSDFPVFENIVVEVLSLEEFAAIDQHALVNEVVRPKLAHVGARLLPMLHLVRAFDDEMIINMIPQLIESMTAMLNGDPDVNLDMTPMFGNMFPHWLAMLNNNAPNQGCTVDLADLFGAGNAQEAAAEMMARAENDTMETVHQGVACDLCDVMPIRGIRYKCCVCSNFDLCSECEASGRHPRSHPLFKFFEPAQGLTRRHMPGVKEIFQKKGGGCRWRDGHRGGHFGHHGPWGNHQGPQFNPGTFRHGGHFDHHNHHGRFSGRRNGHGFSGDEFDTRRGHFYNSQNDVETQSVSSYASSGNTKLKAEFVRDINMPDRTRFPSGQIFEKQWSMRNSGNVTWGGDCFLVFVKGNRTMSLEERYPVPDARPNQIVIVKAMIKTPNKEGRYCSYYRLERDGVKFGPRVWVDIFVNHNGKLNQLIRKREKLVAKMNKTSEKIADITGSPSPPVEPVIEPVVEQVAQPATRPQFEGSNKRPSLKCLCGTNLVKTDTQHCYEIRTTVHCDICGRFCRKFVYHCPAGRNSTHAEGYDLCEGCVNLQMKTFQRAVPQVEIAPEPVVEKKEQAVVEVVVIEPSAPPEIVIVEPQVVTEPPFEYQAQLDNLLAMGFHGPETLKFLLTNHKGNMETILQALFENQ